MGECGCVIVFSLIFSTTHTDRLALHPGQFTPCTFWVGDWDRQKRWSGCVGGGMQKSLPPKDIDLVSRQESSSYTD